MAPVLLLEPTTPFATWTHPPCADAWCATIATARIIPGPMPIELPVDPCTWCNGRLSQKPLAQPISTGGSKPPPWTVDRPGRQA